MSLTMFRRTRVGVYGDSITAGHNQGGGSPPAAPAWTRPLRDTLRLIYGPNAPILMNMGRIGDGWLEADTQFTTRVKPHSPDVMIFAFMTNDLGTATGTLTTRINTAITTATTAANYNNNKVPRAFMAVGAMCSSAVGSEDWTTDKSAITTRNAILQTACNNNGWTYVDPFQLWFQVESTQKAAIVAGYTISPRNPQHVAVPANNSGFTIDGTHVTMDGARVWSAVALNGMVLDTANNEP